MFIGIFLGFVTGVSYGIYQVVEVDDNMAVKAIKLIKIIVEGIS